MGTKIEWAEKTWNPVTGCSPVSEGCAHCYARRMARRLRGRFGYPADEPFRVTVHEDRLEQPKRWRKPRRVFVCSMGDLFHPDVPPQFLARVLNVIGWSPQHTFILLTKRSKQMALTLNTYYELLNDGKPFENVWAMTTIENQPRADERLPWLMRTMAVIRGVSVEPMLGDTSLHLMSSCGYRMLSRWYGPNGFDATGSQPELEQRKPDWVICGAETGPGARPMNLDWARALRDQCQAAGVAFFMKSVSSGEIPEDLMIREYPYGV